MYLRHCAMIELPGDKVKVLGHCPYCEDEWALVTYQDNLQRWVSGDKIQDALPDLSTTEKEYLKTGICESCWNDIFEEEEDD